MFIFKINAVTNIIAFIIGCVYYKNFSKEIKIVFYFVALGVFTEIFSRSYKIFVTQNTGPIGHFYFPMAFFIMGMFYLVTLKDFIKSRYIMILIILFEIFSIINVLFIQDLYEFPSVTGSVGAIIMFLFSVLFFTKVMTEAKILKLSKEPLIWINSAVLIYYTGNFIFYVLLNYANKHSREFAILTAKFFSYVNLLFYLLIAIGFWKVKDNKSVHV
jgi:hypothetical protein